MKPRLRLRLIPRRGHATQQRPAKLLDRLRARYPDLPPSSYPSLAVSFLVLHELTAVVPLVVGFYGLRSVGAGERLVGWAEEVASRGAAEGEGVGDKARRGLGQAVGEAQEKAERLARHYGWFGYEKKVSDRSTSRTGDVRGDVANLVGSYLLVKALMPARIAVSLYYAPAFSRLLVGRAGSALKRMGERLVSRRAPP